MSVGKTDQSGIKTDLNIMLPVISIYISFEDRNTRVFLVIFLSLYSTNSCILFKQADHQQLKQISILIDKSIEINYHKYKFCKGKLCLMYINVY